ncbi:MAG: hypothetical protein WDN72_04955 [Alphaproteobacteria bacterium]
MNKTLTILLASASVALAGAAFAADSTYESTPRSPRTRAATSPRTSPPSTRMPRVR